MQKFTITYMYRGFSEEYETDAENILIALGNFASENIASLNEVVRVEC